MPKTETFWALLIGITGTFLGWILSLITRFFFEKRKSFIKKDLPTVVCEKIIVEQRMRNKDIFGPMSKRIEIKIPKFGPDSELVDVNDLFFAKYSIKNLGNESIENYLISISEKPASMWFTLREAEEQQSPDWERLLIEKIDKEKNTDGDLSYYPIPYLNPYDSSGHEVILELASYLPLNQIKIFGNAKNVNFIFRNGCNKNGFEKFIHQKKKTFKEK